MAQRDDNSAALVDAIYEAPFIPERWPALLQALSRATDGEGGLLLTVDGKHTLNWTACSFVTPLMERFIEGGYEKYNIRPQRGLAKRYPGFMTDQDVMTDEEIEASPIHRDILRPAGIGWSAGTVIPTPSGDLIVFDLSRHIDRGSYDRPTLDLLDGFRPHLARAGLLAARMHLEQARSATDMMAKLGLPSAAVDATGRVVVANDLFEALPGQIDIKARDQIQLLNVGAHTLLSENLERAASSAGPVSSIALPASEESAAAVLHILPIRREAHDLFARTAALLVVTPLEPAAMPHADLLSGLFDLSPAENRVARALMGGASLRECAKRFGVAEDTVRKQLKSVFTKTATSRQTELLRLLASTTSLPIRG